MHCRVEVGTVRIWTPKQGRPQIQTREEGGDLLNGKLTIAPHHLCAGGLIQTAWTRGHTDSNLPCSHLLSSSEVPHPFLPEATAYPVPSARMPFQLSPPGSQPYPTPSLKPSIELQSLVMVMVMVMAVSLHTGNAQERLC